jgi:penicillin-binding protein 1C
VEAGFTQLEKDPNYYGLGLTLGNAGVSLIELTNAYAAVARLGIWHPWTLRMDQLEGGAVTRRVFHPDTAWILADILSDNTARSASFGSNSVLRLPFRCASKTGTSTDYRDNWCVGFTAEFTVGVWIGNFANQPLKNVSGVSGAGPVFHAIMQELHKTTPPSWVSEPVGMVRKTIDRRTGKEISDGMDVPAIFRREELFRATHLPEAARKGDYSAEGLVLLDDFRYADWFRSAENDQKHIYTLQSTQNVRSAVKILSPLNNAVYVLDPEIPGGGSKLALKSTLEESRASWSCESLRIEKSVAELVPGSHRIVLRDTVSGEENSVGITVE